MTWQRVLQQKRRCKKGVDQGSDSCDSYDLTISIKKTEAVYQPASGKHYKEPTITVEGQRLQEVDKFTYIAEAHCQESCTLMMKLMPGLPKLVQHLADYVVVFGIEVESGLTQSWKSTKLWCCQHYCMHAKCGQFTNGTPKVWTTSIQAALENF